MSVAAIAPWALPRRSTFGTIALGGDNNAVTLRYTGTGHSTDRVINLTGTTGSATLDMSGTGTLTFTSALTATGAGSKTLTLTGSTAGIGVLEGAIVNNSVSNTTAVTKTGTGTWVLSGTNSYTGATAVNAGKLFINGNQSSATGNVSVAANATLGGTGTLGGNTTIAAGGKLEFNLSTAAASHNPLDLVAGKGLTFSGASVLTIASSGGAAPGIYTLITGGNNITGVAPATLNLPAGWAATVSISGNSLLLNVTSTGGPGPVASLRHFLHRLAANRGHSHHRHHPHRAGCLQSNRHLLHRHRHLRRHGGHHRQLGELSSTEFSAA